MLYPTGWAAGYGAIRGLVRSADHIVIDALAHTCLQEGANAATRNIYMHRHLDVEHCRHWLQAIRGKDSENGILVVTEGLFSMDSDTPDLAALQAACREYNATLLVDVAHDLGALGPGGRGHIAPAGMLGQVDLVMGSFSKTFASNGGFVACGSRAVKEYLKFYSPTTTFSNALSQVQAAVVLKAFEIVNSAEGDALRRGIDDEHVGAARADRGARARGLRRPFGHRRGQDGLRGRWRGSSAGVCTTGACSPISSNIPPSARARRGSGCR